MKKILVFLIFFLVNHNYVQAEANQINIAAFLLADPITWLTGGTSRALLPAAKYAEKFKNSSLSTIEKVDELFAIPAFSNEQSRLAIRTAELREARRAKNDLRSAAISQRRNPADRSGHHLAVKPDQPALLTARLWLL